MKTKTQQSEIYGIQQVSSKREVYKNTSLLQETIKISNKQPILHLRNEKRKNKQKQSY